MLSQLSYTPVSEAVDSRLRFPILKVHLRTFKIEQKPTEYTLWMDGEEVMVRANQLEFAGDEMEEGMNYYDEESLSLCGVEDFLQIVAAYRNFVQQK